MTDKKLTPIDNSPFRGLGGSYLFGWNPHKFEWANLDQDIARLIAGEKMEDNWSVASHKSIKSGDRAYVVRVGVEPKGIFASGYVSSEPFVATRRGRIHHRINIEFDALLNPDKEPILSLDILKTGDLAAQTWTPQASGISIRPQLVEELEGLWLAFLSEHLHFGKI